MNTMTDTAFDTTAHPRSTASGRFVAPTHSAPEGALTVPSSVDVPVDAAELRTADWQAQARTDDVAARWAEGLPVGPEGEISDHSARLFARDALQSLPDGHAPAAFPLLAEFADAPYTEAGGTDPEKVDALLEEVAVVRNVHDYLSQAQRLRLDMLATFAVHALPGQD